MAADVLLYQGERVPVGDDQRQHLELMRDVAIRFNSRYGDTFVVPEASIPPTGARIMDLQAPENEDVDDGRHRARHRPTSSTRPRRLKKKIMSAVTDSGSEVRAAPDKPGVTALLDILSSVTDTPVAGARGALRRRRLRHLQARRAGRRRRVPGADPDPLRGAARPTPTRCARRSPQGADKARVLAVPTMERVREVVGLLPTR